MPAFSKGSPRLIRGPMHLHNSLSVYRLPIHSRDPVPSSLSLSRKLVSWRNLFSTFFFLSFFSFFFSSTHVLTSEENGARKRSNYFEKRKGGTRVNWTSRKLAITKERKWGADDWKEFPRSRSNDFRDPYIIQYMYVYSMLGETN